MNDLRQRYEELKLLRSNLDHMFQDSQRYVRPNSNEFDHHHTTRKEDDSREIFDDTAVWCNQMFANGLASNMIPKSDRWMYLRAKDVPTAQLNPQELTYLQQVSDRIMHELALPESQFYSASHECFLDIGAYGTSPVQVSYQDGVVNFRTRPLADTFFDVNAHGRVDTVFYRCFKTARQLKQMFPQVEDMQGFDKNRGINSKYELIYTIQPSADKRAKKGGRVGPERPYTVTYGPAFTCLSQIRVLNKMVKEVLISSEYLNFPTLTAEEDSIMLPMKYGSRQVVFHEAGSEKPAPIMAGNQPQYMMDMIRMYRDTINRSFFVDQIIRQEKKERQSVTEIQDTRGQMLNQLAPLINRMESEYIGPAIEITYEMLERAGELPEAPASMNGVELEIAYASPAAQSQYSTRLSDMSAFMRDIAPLAQVKPELMEALNERQLFEDYARYRNVTPTVIRSEEELQQMKQGAAEQQQMMQAAQAAPQIGGAMKDIAQAKSIDPEGVGQLLNI
jgi:hypothetical protein